jgi:hypothetical protein
MKRPNRQSLLPSREIGLRPGNTPALDAVSSHRIVDGLKIPTDTSAYGIADGGPAKTSQDLDVDWTKFENHTFFDSAAGKVNASFLRIINDFPYDGTEKETRQFFDDLSGYEKFVYDQFPKSVGFINFGGSSHIEVIDSAGASFPEYSRDSTGKEVIASGDGPFTVQMFLSASSASNDNQAVVQYLSDESHGFTLLLSQSVSSTSARLIFSIVSGTLSSSVQTTIDKGLFSHIAAVYSPTNSSSSISFFRDGALIATSSQALTLGPDFSAKMFSIASGSAYYSDGILSVPKERFAGAIDDLRVYHSQRTVSQIRESMSYPAYADDETQPGLALYYKFNEPPGSHTQASVALDSSGNSLHSKILGSFTRVTGSSALTHEDQRLSPVLFPDFSETIDINAILLDSGSAYDRENPNYIINLIPRHYFEESQAAFSFLNTQGDLESQIQGNSIPGSGNLGSVQIMTAILLMYAKVFDEIKIFHDHFSRLTYVDYNESESVSNKFLYFLASYYGVELPNLFKRSTLDQYLFGQNMLDKEVSQQPLRAVQALIFRRILTNIRDIITSKGTHAGIHALFNAVGISPNTFFRIREYGGPIAVDLSTVRESAIEVAAEIDMSGSLASYRGTPDSQGFYSAVPHIVGSFLSGSRVEKGFPEAAGSFVGAKPGFIHGLSSNTSDGLLTSGSWTFEASYRFDPDVGRGPQSLARLHVTGTSAPSSVHGVVFNIVAASGSSPTVSAFVSSDTTSAAPPVSLHITGANIFDGNRWHVSLTRKRSDDPSMQDVQYMSSSYQLRCGRITEGGSTTFFSSSGFFSEGLPANNVLQNVSAYNTSGSFIVFGSQSLGVGNYPFLNSGSLSAEVRTTDFSGKISGARFWSKALTDTEVQEHARSFRSIGVEDPLLNFGFNLTSSGSFQRLRMDLSFDQDATGSNSLGEIGVFDFSQQGFSASGAGFEPSASVIKPIANRFTQISPRFDVRQTTDKVRVRSFTQNANLDEFPDSQVAPIYEQTRSEKPVSDNRLAIEASAVDALNDDIIKILSSLDFFESALGDPRVLSEDDYPDLDRLRRIYFNRLTAKPELRAMYEVFKWVSDSLGGLIMQVVPMNSVFLGVSYIIESHIAERAKVRYTFDSVYKQKTSQENAAKSVQDITGGTSTDVNKAPQTNSIRG